MPEVDWSRLKAHELRKLANENAVVILPIASIEQHGPHLPTMVDTRLGQEIAHRAARKTYEKRPVIVTPVVWSGLSEHHMAFGGTLTLSHDTFRRMIRDLIKSITRHGFRDIMLSNSHGGNHIAMLQIVDELSPTLEATLVAATYVTEAGDDLAKHLQDQPNFKHADEAETSMMMVCEPDLVDTSDLANIASPAGVGKWDAVGRTSFRWRPYVHVTANGLTGKPTRASAEKGEKMLEAGANALARLISDPDTWIEPNDLRSPETGGVPFRG